MLVPEQELLDEIGTQQAEALLKPRVDFNGAQRPFAAFVYELGPEVVVREPALPCPRCATTMTKHALFAVVIDRCPAHGVWLEDRELETIVRAAVDGL
jgi:hypothetical protein